jgi:hypothetical protein
VLRLDQAVIRGVFDADPRWIRLEDGEDEVVNESLDKLRTAWKEIPDQDLRTYIVNAGLRLE